MRFLLASLLTFHWMVAFALLAMLAASGPHGLEQVVSMFGAGPELAVDGLTSGVFAVAFALVSALFLWSLLTMALAGETATGPAADVSGMAFGTATGTMTALLVVAATAPAAGLFTTVAIQVAALAASVAAVHAERPAACAVVADEGRKARATARLMAEDAAHSSMLARLSGRTPEGGR